jgi:hypothetical protein
MENKKQVTAVEWLAEVYEKRGGLYKSDIVQAKEMEKKNLESCAIYFMNYALDCVEGVKEMSGKKEFEQYFDVKFKK